LGTEERTKGKGKGFLLAGWITVDCREGKKGRAQFFGGREGKKRLPSATEVLLEGASKKEQEETASKN